MSFLEGTQFGGIVCGGSTGGDGGAFSSLEEVTDVWGWGFGICVLEFDHYSLEDGGHGGGRLVGVRHVSQCGSETFEVLHVVFPVVDIFYEC